MNNAQTMLSNKKLPQREKVASLKAVLPKNKKNDRKKLETTAQESNQYIPVESLTETSKTDSKLVSTNFDLSSNQEFTNLMKTFLEDMVKQAVKEQMEAKNKTEKENTLNAKKNKEGQNREFVKLEQSNNFPEPTDEKNEEKGEDEGENVPQRTYKRPVYVDEPLKKYKLVLIDDGDFTKPTPSERLSKLRIKALKNIEKNRDSHLSSK